MASPTRPGLSPAPTSPRHWLLALLVALFVPCATVGQTSDAPTADTAPLMLAVSAESILAAGAAPGAQVAWFGVSRSFNGQVPTMTRFEEIVVDDDLDGVVELATGAPISERSVFVAVDLGTGALGVLTPNPAAVREVAPPADNVRPDGSGLGARLDRIADRRPYAELFLVRPTVGAWGLSIGKGTQDDEADAEAEGFVAALASFRPLGDTAVEPGEVLGGDVLVAVDRHSLEFYAVRLVR
jgi:hypothetical protein